MELRGYENSLMAGMDEWKRQEDFFTKYGKAEDLEDPKFLKMKLRHMDKLWIAHANGPKTPDTQAMLNVVQFQRQKLSRKLYPGLAGTLSRKISFAIRKAILGMRPGPLSDPYTGTMSYSSVSRINEQGEEQRESQQIGSPNRGKSWDLGSARKNNNKQGLGM